MATGILGSGDLSPATNTTIYTVPATTFSVVSVSICNRGTSTSAVTVGDYPAANTAEIFTGETTAANVTDFSTE